MLPRQNLPSNGKLRISSLGCLVFLIAQVVPGNMVTHLPSRGLLCPTRFIHRAAGSHQDYVTSVVLFDQVTFCAISNALTKS